MMQLVKVYWSNNPTLVYGTNGSLVQWYVRPSQPELVVDCFQAASTASIRTAQVSW